MANVTDPADMITQNPMVVSAPVSAAPSPASGPASLLDDPFIPQVVELCKASFPGDVTVESMVDPSEPDDPWLAFNVTSRERFAEIFKRESDWHEQVERLTGDRTGKYRLSVYPVE